MSNNKNDSNMQWKKSGFEPSERITLKVNVKKAVAFDAKNKNNVQKAYSGANSSLPNSINKIRKKIKDTINHDLEDDEEEYQLGPDTIDQQNSLLVALSAEEKKALKQQDNLRQNQLLNNTQKLKEASKVSSITKNLGLKELKEKEIIKDIISFDGQDKKLAQKVISKKLAQKLGIKIPKTLDEKELKKLSRGIKRIRKIGSNDDLKNMKVKKILEIGEKDTEDKRVAEMILEKSGRDKNQKSKRAKDLRLNKADRKYINEKLAQERSHD